MTSNDFETTLTVMEIGLLMDGLDPSIVFVDLADALPPSVEEATEEDQ
jgi:hypothetical protein